MEPTIDQMASMTDEDFLKMEVPSDTAAPEKTPEEVAAEEAARIQAQADADAQAQADAAAAKAAEDAAKVTEQPGEVQVPGSTTVEEPVTKTPEELAAEAAAKAEADKNKTPEQLAQEKAEADAKAKNTQPAGEVDYKATHEQIMAPFKANGKTMQVKSVDEAIQLMQMGANYTRKMQELQPHRKTLLMLENNGLLDEGKLSFLIDLDKKNPEAIKKLLQDAKIDPLDVDLEKESTYQEGNHKVSDEEAQFRLVLDELNSNPVGRETLQTINSTWDQASKEVLWKQPEVMNTIHQQRENGVYARIMAEIDRRRTLGVIQVGVPFLEAYRVVGDELHKAGAFNDLFKPKATAVAPVATRAAMPKPTGLDPKADAAAVHRGSPSKTTSPLEAMQKASDDEFLKMPIPR